MINPYPQSRIADSRWAIRETSISTGPGERMACLNINVRDGDGFLQMMVPLPRYEGPYWEDIGFRKKVVKDD